MTTRRILAALSAVGVAGLTLLASPAAYAAELELADPARDSNGPGLDVVGVEVSNDDYRLATTVDYRVNRSGTTIVGVKARNRAVVRVVNYHRVDGDDKTFLIDHNDARVSCPGLRSDWDTDDAELTVSVPSSCLWRGNYGAVQPWVLTEPLDSGRDVDLLTTKQWIARG
jgi:hypothetical protein